MDTNNTTKTNGANVAPMQPPRKYIMTGKTTRIGSRTLFRIQAVIDIPAIGVKAGDYGGYIECEQNLAHAGSCWVFDEAAVYDSARVYDHATIHNSSVLRGRAVACRWSRVSGESVISDAAIIRDHARVDDSLVYGTSVVKDSAAVHNGAQVFGHSIISDSVQLHGTIADSEDYGGNKFYWFQDEMTDGYIPAEYAPD